MDTAAPQHPAAAAVVTGAAPSAHAPSSRRRLRVRTAVYAAVLACLSGVLMFWELGADALTGDEAQYALVVQNMKRFGDWIYLSPYPPTPYLQKPPFYFWLTAATYDRLGREEFAHRAWSAAAGVGAVVLTCVLGAALFSPEVGALAGLLLMMNRAFLLVHGARSGTFDALVAFLVTAAVLLYWLTAPSRRLHWLGWAGVGALAGLASLTKPFVGVPVVALLAVHWFAFRRTVPLPARLGAPALGLLALAAVAAPWYAAQAQRYDHFAAEMFGRNVIDRVARGVDDKHVEDWKFYLEQVSKSSLPFLLALPAMAYGVLAWIRGTTRSAHAVLTLTGLGWIVLFSFSASKAIHYVYPAFPPVAILIAGGAARLVRGPSHEGAASKRRRLAFGALAGLLVVFAFQYARTLYHAIPADRSPYVPWEMYKVLAPAIDSGDARVIFHGFPEQQVDWRDRMRLLARDAYYLEQMRRPPAASQRPAATWTRDAAHLGNLLHEGKPTLLVLARGADLRALLENSDLLQRADDRFVYAHQGFLVLGIDLAPLLEPVTKVGEANPYLRIDDGTAADRAGGTVRLTATPPVAGAAARVSVRLRLADPAAAPELIRYVFALRLRDGSFKRVQDATVRPVDGIIEVSAAVEQALWAGAGPGPREITLALRPAGAGTQDSVRSTVEEARLTMLPHIPAEPHPRR